MIRYKTFDHSDQSSINGKAMNLSNLKTECKLGEDSRRQFKVDVKNANSLAAEMAAFANCEGGDIYIGISDNGGLEGISMNDLGRINQLISNAASQLIRSPLNVSTQNIALENGRVAVKLTVPKGLDKPYFDKNGIIWLKCGSDKRKINSKEELKRVYQSVNQFHADELPTKAGLEKLDKLRFRDFLKDYYQQEFPETNSALLNLLQNLNLASSEGRLNLAGLLLFAENPEWIKPQFIIKAIRYPGNEIHSSRFIDSEDFVGPLDKVFKESLSFITRNLFKVQSKESINYPGSPEIPQAVFEELLVNALSHRDYLISAPIRLFIFDNRIEIVSPGHLPNNLTVDKIKAGNSNIRNPIMVSFIAKGILPYRGLGSGIKRALDNWSRIEFKDDRDGCLFTATIYRDLQAADTLVRNKYGKSSDVIEETATPGYSEGLESSREGSETAGYFTTEPKKTSEKIVAILKNDPYATIAMLAGELNLTTRAVEKQLSALKASNRIRRVGAKKNGFWNVIS